MNEKYILRALDEVEAAVKGSHVVYTSGKHGTDYINKDAVYPHTHLTSRLTLQIALHFKYMNVEVVAAPAIGGVILSQWGAYHLSYGNHVLGVYAEHEEISIAKARGEELLVGDVRLQPGDELLVRTGRFVFKRGYDKLVTGRRVLILEDVINTGGSVMKVIEAAKRIGGDVVGVGALCNRGGVTAEELGVPELFSLINLKLDAYSESECPLCKSNVPINTRVGKGADFLARRGKRSENL